jgi:formylglycine-generating enzyme required for sulfatase activity
VQDNTTTEDGAHVQRPGWRSAAQRGRDDCPTSEDEWYKAAYYDPSSASYFDYPAGTDTQTTCDVPGATANTANCNFAVADLTDVGSYTGSASPYGTFDQGGNDYEWNEPFDGLSHAAGGGAVTSAPPVLAASTRIGLDPTTEVSNRGFRVVPEPGRDVLLVAGVLNLLGLAGWRRVCA